MNQSTKKNSNRFFALLFCLSLASFATAQSRTMGSLMPAPSAEAVISDLSSELSLSAGQIEKLTKICNSHQEKQVQKVEAAKSSSASQAQSTDGSQDELNREISTILTQQQRSLFTALTRKYSPSF